MNLLFVARSLETVGGAERVLAQVASGLAGKGHKVEVLSFKERSTVDFYCLHSEVRRTKFLVSDYPAQRNSLRILAALPQLRAHLICTRPDVAIGFMASAYIPLALAAIRTNVALVASEHTTFDHYRTRPFQRLALNLVAPLFQAVTTTSERVRAGFPSRVGARMVPIPNPVEAPTTVTSAAPGKRHVLLSVGSLRREKGHSVLLSAFAQLAPMFPEWNLWLVGEGVERPKLEQQARQMGLDRRVEFHGVVSDVAALYAAADIFVAPSYYESFGIAAAEAMAAGLPVVAFADCAGLAELVEPNTNGLLLAGNDRPAALVQGLGRLMADEKARKRMGAAAPESVRPFQPNRVVDQWEELLQAVARSHRPLKP